MAPDDNNDEDFGKMLAEFEQQTGATPRAARP
jgi:hypothetical protein